MTIIKNKYNFDKNFYNWYKKTNYDEVDGFFKFINDKDKCSYWDFFER